MKIAILLPNNQPQLGGGYTFPQSILNALMLNAEKSKHEFFVFGWEAQDVQELSLYPNLYYISLHRNIYKRIVTRLSWTPSLIIKKILNFSNDEVDYEIYENLILTALKENSIDMIWSLTPYCPTMEIPYILTLWDLEHRNYPYFPEVSENGTWLLRESYYSKFLKRAAIVITGTEVGKTEIENFYQLPSKRIKVLHFPVPKFNVNTEANDLTLLLNNNIPKNYLFYPAQFWPHKNHITLLKAIKHLQNKYDLNLPVVFVGSDKGNENYVKEYTRRLDLEKRVYFLGFVSREDLFYLYKNALALTFVTHFGPDNLPPLEAFSLGCPVIASKVSGANEQLGNAAMLVDPEDEEQIAEAIKSVYDKPHLRKMLIQRGFERISQRTEQKYIENVFEILDEFEPIRSCWK
jgi:glycosyltransferase involved in cell wall biosynthesis